jgi:hypothetical protein
LAIYPSKQRALKLLSQKKTYSNNVREQPLFSENFVNWCYCQNNANQNAETAAHTHTADSGLDCNSLVCFRCNSGVCDRALKKAQDVKNVTIFCCLSIFATTSF